MQADTTRHDVADNDATSVQSAVHLTPKSWRLIVALAVKPALPVPYPLRPPTRESATARMPRFEKPIGHHPLLQIQILA
jgi:hypothetical protein